MKLRELIKYLDYNQKVMLTRGRYSDEFRGVAREINLIAFGDREIDFIYLDDDIYTRDYLKIRLKPLQQ